MTAMDFVNMHKNMNLPTFDKYIKMICSPKFTPLINSGFPKVSQEHQLKIIDPKL